MTKLAATAVNVPAPRPVWKQSPLAVLSLVVAMATLLAEAANVACGLLGAPRMTVAILILAATAPAALGLVLAIASLIRREDDGRLGQYGLWVHGIIVVFALPLSLAWSLAAR